MDGAAFCDSHLMQVAPFPLSAGMGPGAGSALLDEQAPVCCALTHLRPSWRHSAQLLSKALTSSSLFVFGTWGFSFLLFDCEVIFHLLFLCLFFWAWSYDFKIYSFYFCVWSRKGDFSMSAPSLLLTKTICHFIYGFLSLFKIFTRACVVNVYISGCICHDADLLWFIKPFS